MKTFGLPLLALTLVGACAAAEAAAATKPNIIFILCDDLGYGDVHCLNPARGKIATPCLDRLASQGMIFSDAHSSSAVCTPSRYGILTGRYNWRSHLQSGVLSGMSPPLVAADRLTVPRLLHEHGYATACIGKWHLGMTMPRPLTAGRIADGPTTRGFDHYFGISASLDMAPFAFIENDHFTESPTAEKEPYLKRRGPAAPGFEAVNVLPTLTRKAVEYVAAHAAKPQPYFLYLPLNSPHTPLVPAHPWRGKSGLGSYADFVMQTDAAIGEVVAAVDAAGAAANTLIIVTSDNGCAPYVGTSDQIDPFKHEMDDVRQLEARGHFPSAQYRGYKSDAWDGGHHVPFLARWPAVVKPGSRTGQLLCLNDLMATCAELLGVTLPPNAGEDSVSYLPLLRGEDKPLHEVVVHHSISGHFAIRDGRWKLILSPGAGGWGDRRERLSKAEEANRPPVQLYDMSRDEGEQKNLQAEHPEVVARLTALLEKYVADGRSTPGPSQKNDAQVVIHKVAGGGKKARE